MKRYLFWIFFGISLLGCTGCFDLHEEVYLKKDGSGTYSFTTDLGQFKSFFDGFGKEFQQKMKESKDSGDQKDFAIAFDSLSKKLKTIDGVEHVKMITDTANLKFGVALQFKNVSALNKALNVIYKDDDETDATNKKKEEIYFEMRDNSFIRYETDNTKKLFENKGLKDVKGKDDMNNLFGGMDALFQTVSYTCTYEFDREIKSVSNESSLISSNFKKVSITCHPFVKDTKEAAPCTLTNIITLK